jgi:ClpP class serine protease
MNPILLIEPNYYAGKERAWADADKIEVKAESFVLDDKEDEFDGIYSVENGVANIEIRGELSNEELSPLERLFGFRGVRYAAIREALTAAEVDPAVQEIRLNIDSPGGTVAGVDATWQAIYRTKKPVVAYVDGLLASAAYWLASAADKIIARNVTDSIGSIGIVVRAVDSDGMFEKDGAKFYNFTSSNAPAKSIKSGEWAVSVQNQIDALERIFIARIAKGRKLSEEYVRENFGNGGCLTAFDPDDGKPSALKNRMIDEIINGGSAYYVAAADEIINNRNAPIPSRGEAPDTEGIMNEKMTLDEFLARDHEVAADFTRRLAEARAEERIAVNGETAARMAKILPVLEGNAYPQSINAIAIKALKGESSLDAFEGALTAYDALKEQQNNEKAQTESKPITTDPPRMDTPERSAAKDVMAKKVAESKAKREAMKW